MFLYLRCYFTHSNPDQETQAFPLTINRAFVKIQEQFIILIFSSHMCSQVFPEYTKDRKLSKNISDVNFKNKATFEKW